ncbi:MAG: phage holin family protein [Verrucomicrobiota bacterium]
MSSDDSSGSFLKRGVVSAMGVGLGSWSLDGITFESNWDLLWAVLSLGILSAIVKPILVLFTLPFVFLTLGLGLLLINAALYLLVGQIVPGFHVQDFWAAFWGALIVTLLNGVFSGWIKGQRRRVSFMKVDRSSRKRGSRRISRDDDVIDI